MSKHSGSFFERLTGNINIHDETDDEDFGAIIENVDEEETEEIIPEKKERKSKKKEEKSWIEEASEEGQLSVDMFQNPTEIIIKAMLAGVKAEDLDVSIDQDAITLRGSRKSEREVEEDNYYYKELYWGDFSRTILLPQEVDPENAEASMKNGLLVIKLPKLKKDRSQKLKIKVE